MFCFPGIQSPFKLIAFRSREVALLGYPLLGFMATGHAQENLCSIVVGPGLPLQPCKGHHQGWSPSLLPVNFSLGLGICQF